MGHRQVESYGHQARRMHSAEKFDSHVQKAEWASVIEISGPGVSAANSKRQVLNPETSLTFRALKSQQPMLPGRP